MSWQLLQKLKASFSLIGGISGSAKRTGRLEDGQCLYTPSELASIRRDLKVANARTRESVRRNGVTMHPDVAAARIHPSSWR